MNKILQLRPETLAGMTLKERGIERFQITDRTAWLAMRRQDVTASSISALIGCSEYQTAYSLWSQKCGLISDEEDETIIDEASISLSPLGRGLLLENAAQELLSRLRPTWHIEKCRHYYRDAAHRIGATPDLIVYDPLRGLGTVQIKNPEASIYRRKWKSDDDESFEPPLDYVVQTNVEANLIDAKWAAVGVLVISHRAELRLIDIPLHPGLISTLRDKVSEFWHMVEQKTPPAFDYGRDGELISKLHGEDLGTEVDLSNDNMLPVLAAERESLKDQIKAFEARCGEIENEFKAKIGDHAVGRLSDRRQVTWKTQNRKGYTVEPTSFRVLRIGKLKG